MTNRKTSLTVELPAAEAADLAMQAAMEGITTPALLGYHVLRSAYGMLHPHVAAYEARPKLGRRGTNGDGEETAASNRWPLAKKES